MLSAISLHIYREMSYLDYPINIFYMNMFVLFIYFLYFCFFYSLSSSYNLFKFRNYIITIIITICLLILPLQVFLRNQVRESSKQRIQGAWSTSIHHVKWWISCFRGAYHNWIHPKGEFWVFKIFKERGSGFGFFP